MKVELPSFDGKLPGQYVRPTRNYNEQEGGLTAILTEEVQRAINGCQPTTPQRAPPVSLGTLIGAPTPNASPTSLRNPGDTGLHASDSSPLHRPNLLASDDQTNDAGHGVLNIMAPSDDHNPHTTVRSPTTAGHTPPTAVSPDTRPSTDRPTDPREPIAPVTPTKIGPTAVVGPISNAVSRTGPSKSTMETSDSRHSLASPDATTTIHADRIAAPEGAKWDSSHQSETNTIGDSGKSPAETTNQGRVRHNPPLGPAITKTTHLIMEWGQHLLVIRGTEISSTEDTETAMDTVTEWIPATSSAWARLVTLPDQDGRHLPELQAVIREWEESQHVKSTWFHEANAITQLIITLWTKPSTPLPTNRREAVGMGTRLH
jgi:hypothetical protein